MKKALLLLAFVAASARATTGGSVLGSKHDFSASGPAENRVGEATSPCFFCHASHGGAAGLSNRPESNAPVRTYDSDVLGARAGLPTGSSRACLSCHDGTVAVGATLKRERHQGTGARIGPQRRSNLGTDLRTSHPVSMRASSGQRSHAPYPGQSVTADAQGQVQCTSCHDPHRSNGDPLVGKFLVMPIQRSALCLECHDTAAYQAVNGSHAQSAASLPADVELPFRSVGEAGCLACHAVHGAQPNTRLVVRGGVGDDDSACLRCHAGATGGPSIALDMAKPWSHSVPGRHDATEGPNGRSNRLPESSPGARRHAVCADCHDPHSANASDSPRPYADGALAGVWGIDLSGQRVEAVQYEYEVCLKCHGDSANKPQASGPTPPETVRRAMIDVNLRRVFAPTAVSSHPVATPRRQADVPSLKPEWAAATGITCSDCHSSSGGGARGPHGSVYPHLLELEYRTADRTPEGPQSYALCYKCHDREKVLSDLPSSGFRYHRLHVVDGATACATCHNAHGVSAQAGTAEQNTHLIDFDVTVVGKSSSGQRVFQDGGLRTGSCNLTCHSRQHDGVTTGRY